MKNNICVYDFETDDSNPNTCQPVQLAACMVHPITLDIIENSEFVSYMRPEDIDDEDYFDNHKDTIYWHAKNYNPNYDKFSSAEQTEAAQTIYTTWFEAPSQKQVWTDFRTYLLKYNKNQARRDVWNAPIRAGANIRRFDNIIVDRLCDACGMVNNRGEQKIFYPRDVIDILELSFYWFENRKEPKAYNMEELRAFFGMSPHGAHDALNDVRDEAQIIQRFIKIHRHFSPKVGFKNSFKVKAKVGNED